MRAAPVLALTLLLPAWQCLAGQAPPPYDRRQLDGARFAEQVHTEITTQSGSAERRRLVVRAAQLRFAVRGDSLIVTADTLDLRETTGGAQRTIDMDAVIGGRWIAVFGSRGRAGVTDRPFVPDEIADVSDVGSIMDDFLPAVPPSLLPGGQATDSSSRRWSRLADSATLSRYHWSAQGQGDTLQVAADSVAVRTSSTTREDGDVAWERVRGPVAWTRRIQTTATSRFAGRTSRAVVDQRIVVRRIP